MFGSLCATFTAYRKIKIGLNRTGATNARNRFIHVKEDARIFRKGYDYVFTLQRGGKTELGLDVLHHFGFSKRYCVPVRANGAIQCAAENDDNAKSAFCGREA